MRRGMGGLLLVDRVDLERLDRGVVEEEEDTKGLRGITGIRSHRPEVLLPGLRLAGHRVGRVGSFLG